MLKDASIFFRPASQDQLAKRLGVSRARIARIEKRGYDAYTLTTLRRYVQALGEDFTLQVAVRRVDHDTPARPLVAHR